MFAKFPVTVPEALNVPVAGFPLISVLGPRLLKLKSMVMLLLSRAVMVAEPVVPALMAQPSRKLAGVP